MKCNIHNKPVFGKLVGSHLTPKSFYISKRISLRNVALFSAIILCLLVSGKLSAQDATVTLKESNSTLESVFKKIEQQTGYKFIYQTQTIKSANSVTLTVQNISLKEALELCFSNQPLVYRIRNKTITVSTKPPGSEGIINDPQKLLNVKGQVVNDTREPVSGASVVVKGFDREYITDEDGRFSIRNVPPDATITTRCVNCEKAETAINGRTELTVYVKSIVGDLGDVTINVSTGYQKISKARTTGSYVQLSNELVNRRVSTNIIDRMDGVTSGLIFNSNIRGGENESAFSIRGRSTIFANTNPLVIIDNFPYEGDINNINPNDVESITVLKDAAAASIWGSRSSNGVVVITTKSGKINTPLSASVVSNLTIGKKPNLFYQNWISNSDYIDLERTFFNNGYYNSAISSTPQGLFSPAVQIMLNQRNGLITDDQATQQLNAISQYDIRNDLMKYFNQTSINQQYNVNLSGGGRSNNYYFSVGYDKNRSSSVGNGYQRISVTAKNGYRALKDKLEINTNLAFTYSLTNNNAQDVNRYQPYQRLVDDNGNALPIYKDSYNKSYYDTVGIGLLKDWSYRPYDELKQYDNKTNLTDYRVGMTAKYRILSGFDVSAIYQYNKGLSVQHNLSKSGSYAARSAFNRFAQINYTTKTITETPFPDGAILDNFTETYYTHNFRTQFSYNTTIKGLHNIVALSGFEVFDYNSDQNSSTLYGYDERNATAIPINPTIAYPTRPNNTPYAIGTNAGRLLTTNRFVSYFVNLSYSYKNRYTFSASARKDESNLFGVNANQKGVPLWSAGLGWEISRERFYRFKALPFLKLRLTNGYNGNVDKTVSAYTTATPTPIRINRYGALQYEIVNPPNPDLKWERVNVWNVGIDFKAANNRLSGSIEYFVKRGKDLIGNSPIAGNTGISNYRGNNADLITKGFDVAINSNNLTGSVKWTTNYLLSYSVDRVTRFGSKPPQLNTYLTATFDYPYEGKPYNSVFALRWAGLNPATGDPRGIKDKEISEDYNSLYNINNSADLIYMGSARPQYFGSIRNNVEFKGITLSINVTYKFKYYFRTNSFNSSSVGSNGFVAFQPGYEERWQNPGDEARTHVPAFRYPLVSNRELFYSNSEVLVEKGNHVRLQDIRIGYDLTNLMGLKKAFKSLQIYSYLNNIGMVWKATETKNDPDFPNGIPAPFTFSFGVNANF